MRKKIISLVCLFVFTLTLSGCHIPFTNVVFTTPFFEKNPEKVMQLMIQTMTNDVNSYTFNTNADISLNIDMKQLTKKDSNRIKDTVAIINNDKNGKVLGVEEITKDAPQELLSSDPRLSMPRTNLSPSLSEKINLKINFNSIGTTDKTDKNNFKNESQNKITLDFNDNKFNMGIDNIKIGRDTYLKITELPSFTSYVSLMLGIDLNKYSGIILNST